MANVELVNKNSNEPWVILTLSKREAAGVCALMAADNANLIPFHLFDELDELFEPGGFDWESEGLRVESARETSDYLDAEFGKL